jgi:hypothetical protein
VRQNRARAKYGPYIHDGFKGWAPDQFIYKAFAAKKQVIMQRLTAAVQRAIKKVGF